MKYNDKINTVLSKLKIETPQLLGEGGEGNVFAYTDNKVVKIYKDVKHDYLRSVKDFQKTLSKFNLPFDLPLIFEIGCIDGAFYTIERKLNGITLDKLFGNLSPEDRFKILKQYFDALKYLHAIKLPHLPYGQVLKPADEVKSGNWQKFLIAKMEDKIGYSRKWLEKDVTEFEEKVIKFYETIHNELAREEKTVVHGDYFYGNVLVSNLQLTAIIDFSPLSVVGDYRMDISGAITFLELSELFKPEHISYLYDLAVKDYGEEIRRYIAHYRVYYSFYFANSYEFDKNLYMWCVRGLNNKQYW